MVYRLFPFRKRLLSLSLLLSVMLSLTLAACGGANTPPSTGGSSGATSAPQQASVPSPTDLITPGVLTVGSDTTYPPQEYIDPQTKHAAGFDVDLITAMAGLMGLKANVVTSDFSTIFDSLNNKRYDVVISAITINSDRSQKNDFITYFSAGESLLVATGNPQNFKTIADLCGQNVGVQKGTAEQDDLTAASKACTTAGKQAINMTILDSQEEVINLLANKRVVATYQDSPVTVYYNRLNPGQFAIAGSVVNAAPEGIAVRKNDTSMQTSMQAAFDMLKSNGTYHQLIVKWGLTDEEIH